VTLALDGSISSYGNVANSLAIASSAALTTANAGDLIVAIVCGQDQTSAWTVTDVTSATLGWNLWKRWQYVGGPSGNHQTIEVWYAWATGTISEVITAHFSQGVTASTAHFFGVRGVDTSYPFDETPNIPIFNSNLTGSSSLPNVSGVSTRETDTMMVKSDQGGCETTQAASALTSAFIMASSDNIAKPAPRSSSDNKFGIFRHFSEVMFASCNIFAARLASRAFQPSINTRSEPLISI